VCINNSSEGGGIRMGIVLVLRGLDGMDRKMNHTADLDKVDLRKVHGAAIVPYSFEPMGQGHLNCTSG
jgi:hypothetical protein